LLLAAAIAVVSVAALAVTAHPSRRVDSAAPQRSAPAATPGTAPPILPRVGLARTTRTATVRVVPSPSAELVSVLRAGILLPIRAESNGFLRIETPCELDGWVSRHDVVLDPPAAKTAAALRDATIVI